MRLLYKIILCILFLFLFNGSLFSQYIYKNNNTALVHIYSLKQSDTIIFLQFYENKIKNNDSITLFFQTLPDSVFFSQSYFIGQFYISLYNKLPNEIIDLVYEFCKEYNANYIVDFYEPRFEYNKDLKKWYYKCYGKLFYIENKFQNSIIPLRSIKDTITSK